MLVKKFIIKVSCPKKIKLPSSQEIFWSLSVHNYQEKKCWLTGDNIMEIKHSVDKEKENEIFEIEIKPLPNELEWDGPWE